MNSDLSQAGRGNGVICLIGRNAIAAELMDGQGVAHEPDARVKPGRFGTWRGTIGYSQAHRGPKCDSKIVMFCTDRLQKDTQNA